MTLTGRWLRGQQNLLRYGTNWSARVRLGVPFVAELCRIEVRAAQQRRPSIAGRADLPGQPIFLRHCYAHRSVRTGSRGRLPHQIPCFTSAPRCLCGLFPRLELPVPLARRIFIAHELGNGVLRDVIQQFFRVPLAGQRGFHGFGRQT